ncbi:hypothetical protein D3C80_582610 [compost metagenome]
MRGLQFTDDLAHADRGILLRQHVGEVDLDGAQQVRQRPGLAAGFVEHVVDLQPRGLDHFFVKLRHLARQHRFGLQGAVELDPADAGRQPLRQRTQASGDVTQPVVEVVGAGVEQCALLIRRGQAVLVAGQGVDAFLELRFARRQDPALVVEVEARLGLGQVGVFGGLRLRAGEVLAQGAAQVTHLDQHAVFPAGHVVHPQAWREAVVGNVATGLVEQGTGHGLEGFDGGVADNHLLAGLFCSRLGVLLHREQVGLGAPVPAQAHAHQQVQADQRAQGTAEQQPAEITAGSGSARFDPLTRLGFACTVFPVQHGVVLSVTSVQGVRPQPPGFVPARWAFCAARHLPGSASIAAL